MRKYLTKIHCFFYKLVLKRFLFIFDPEKVHEFMTSAGEFLGKTPKKGLLNKILVKNNTKLTQLIGGIEFINPMGLAAGFDYDARLTQILPSLDFGFETVGTITNLPYLGNPRPILGRLPKSKSLMVNKGFRNQGAELVARKMSKMSFEFPIGISIGQTNTSEIKTINQAIKDVVSAFRIFENKGVENSYYELNISCPNLFTNTSFYPPENLDELLEAVDNLKITKPIFIKMPINEEDGDFLKMLDVIMLHNISGVIIGNLQKNKKTLHTDETNKFSKGSFSGLPTQRRSDELISLAYKHCIKNLVIIGCGGIFNTTDAYKKIRLGANLLQLITGLIYEGPLLVAKINCELPELLKRDGFLNIGEAVGVDSDYLIKSQISLGTMPSLSSPLGSQTIH